MGDWISVKDRLPVEDCKVRIKSSLDRNPISYEWVKGIGWYDGWGGQEMGERNKSITHWMYIPSPPRDEND